MNKEELKARLLATFRAEAEGHLHVIGKNLLALEQGLPDGNASPLFEETFRAMHTLKGAARAVGLDDVETVCQACESVVGRLREGRLRGSPEIVSRLHTATQGVARILAEGSGAVKVGDLISALEDATVGRDTRAPGLMGEAPPLGRARLGASAGKTAAPETVLVVDDSITARTLERKLLEAAGYRVRVAVDGMEAWNTLKTEKVNLVLSDVDMPRMDGLELTRRIREDRDLAHLPVVLVTSLESREDKERGVGVGANAYVVKSSLDGSSLLEIIRRLV